MQRRTSSTRVHILLALMCPLVFGCGGPVDVRNRIDTEKKPGTREDEVTSTPILSPAEDSKLGAATSASDGSYSARNLVAEGNIKYRQLRFAEALAKYDEAIRGDDKYATAHNNRGLALHKLCVLNDATAALQKAVELDGGKAAFHLNLGKIQAAAGRYEEAIEALNKALEIDPKMSVAVYNQGWVLDAQGQTDKAAEACRKLAGMDERPPGTKLLAGIVETRRGRAEPLAEATCSPTDLPQQWRWLTEANRCLGTGGIAELTPNGKAALRKALHAVSIEQFAAAQEHLAEAQAAAPGHPLPGWLSAMAWSTQDDQPKAEAAMKQAVALMPTFSVAKHDDPMVLLVDGIWAGSAPVTASVLPGVHLIAVLRHGKDGYGIFNQCCVLQPGINYALPAVKFQPMPVPNRLPVPSDTRSSIQAALADRNSIGMALVEISPGEFLMGSPESERGNEIDEKPQHRVGITQPFYFGACEVTQGEYAGVMGKNPSHFASTDTAQLPVERVSWYDAVDFCNRLSEKEGLPAYYALANIKRDEDSISNATVTIVGGNGYRLPTEAEWEYACRAGATTPWSFGDDEAMLGEYAWFKKNSDNRPHPIKQKKPNPWGLYDMHGNLWEWCADGYAENYYAKSPAENPVGPDDTVSRVLRGGSWYDDYPGSFRCALRIYGAPDALSLGYGFRVARTLTP